MDQYDPLLFEECYKIDRENEN